MRKSKWAARAVLGSLVLAVSCIPPQKAEAQIFGGTYCINCASEVTALAQKVTQGMQYLQEAQTALHAIQMTQMMATEGINLAKHPTWNVTQDMMTLQTVLQASQGLAGDAANIDATFRAQYSPFSPSPVVSYAGAYNTWAKETLNTLQGTLRNAGMQQNLLQNQNLWIQQVELMNQTPMGRDQSIQLGNTIGLQTVKSLMALEQLMTQDTVAKQAVAAQSLNVNQARQQASQNAFYYAGVNTDTRTW